MTDRFTPESNNSAPSRVEVKKLISDFPAIREAYRNDPTKDESVLSVQKEFAAGYLESIMNLPNDERQNWSDEIDGLGGILWVWEHRYDTSQW